jgi:hypothetical protein
VSELSASPTSGWRAPLVRGVLVIAVLVGPIVVAIWATRIGSPVPVRVMAWIAAGFLVAYPVYRATRRGRTRDYTVENVAWLVALAIGLLAISPSIFPWESGGHLGRARLAKAQAGVRTLTQGIEAYKAHTGKLPPDLAALTAPAKNARGETAGPFVQTLPTVPADWTPYRYDRTPDGSYRVETSGDGKTASGP